MSAPRLRGAAIPSAVLFEAPTIGEPSQPAERWKAMNEAAHPLPEFSRAYASNCDDDPEKILLWKILCYTSIRTLGLRAFEGQSLHAWSRI